MIGELRSVFESFGYVPIETPHLEYRDVLVKQGSSEIQKQLYSFTGLLNVTLILLELLRLEQTLK